LENKISSVWCVEKLNVNCQGHESCIMPFMTVMMYCTVLFKYSDRKKQRTLDSWEKKLKPQKLLNGVEVET